MAVLEEGKWPMELIVHIDHRAYNFEEVRIVNGTGNAVTINEIVGLPLNANNQIITAANANTTAKLVFAFGRNPLNALRAPITIPAGQSSQHTFLVLSRGPAIVNRKGIVDKDHTGADYNKTTIETALKALNPPVLVQDPPFITQTVEA